MNHRYSEGVARVPTIDLLARAIEHHAHAAGDHLTALPALSIHRRDAPTQPVHCVYDFGLAVTTQGGKQVMLGEDVSTTVRAGPC